MAPSKTAPAKNQSRPQQNQNRNAPAKARPAPAKSAAPAKSVPAKAVAAPAKAVRAPAKVTPPPPVEEEVDLETEVTAVAPEPVQAAPAKKGGRAPAKASASTAPVVQSTAAPAKRGRAPAKASASTAGAKTAPAKARGKRAEPVEAVEAEDAEDDASGKRSFKLVSSEVDPALPQTVLSSIEKGTYKGKTPMQAGKKCFSQICRRMMKEENNPSYSCTFTIRESTRKSAGKRHTYHGERRELDTPQVISRDGTEYSIRFVNVVHAVKAEAEATA